MEKYIVVESRGVLRRLAKVIERPDGDLLIVVFGGVNKGESQTDRLKDMHFSVHMSPRILEGNQVKMTFKSIEDELTSSAFTSGIKGAEGFWNILSFRYTDLADDYYKFDGVTDYVLIPGAFEPQDETLILGFSVGAASESFEHAGTDCDHYPLQTAHFHLVLFVKRVGIFASKQGHLFFRKTINPDDPPHGITSDQAYALMRGVSAGESAARFVITSLILVLQHIQNHRKDVARVVGISPDLKVMDEILTEWRLEVGDELARLILARPDHYPFPVPLPFIPVKGLTMEVWRDAILHQLNL